MSDGMVQIAYLHPEHVSHSWHDSMRRSLAYDRTLPQRRLAEKPLNIRCGAGRLVPSRNFASELFLDHTDHEWLLFIDTDMGWEDDAIHRLLDAADPAERPVMGGLCFALMEAQYDGSGGYRFSIIPTMYKLGVTTQGARPSFCYYGDYEDDKVTRVAGTGAAFLLIHRSVLEKLRVEHGNRWWDQMYDEEGTMVGEDIAFCARLGSAGIPVHVHTGIRTTHHKQLWIAEDDYHLQRVTSVPVDPALPPVIDVAESLLSLASNEHVHDGMLKTREDLDRYARIIATTRPEVIVETGTHTGASARWFAEQGVDVITIDIATDLKNVPATGGVTYIRGDSADAELVAELPELIAGRRCMVSLDSDHSAAHVAREIDLYGPLVSPGCYLVVEDGIFGYAPKLLRAQQGMGHVVGSPLDAIAAKLTPSADWSRDLAIEKLSPVSHHPAGWWVRNG